MSYSAHPLADLIPRMSDEEYARLREDIAANGLLDAITLYEGQVLDGRHRLRACEETGAEPSFVEYEGDSPAQFVLSHNLHRRHLSVSQRAMIATDFLPHLEREAGNRVGENLRTAPRDERGWVLPMPSVSSNDETLDRSGWSGERAAAEVGVGAATVTRANRIVKDAPDLAERVRTGEMTVGAAHGIVQARANGDKPPKPENGSARPAAVSRIADQAAGMAMAIEALNLRKSCERMTDDERSNALDSCKAGLKALNTMANALGR